ncbi:MAG: glycosyltransferase family 9 protein [Ignavibacteria bacterium]|nr:glycosyltransferase family 9 protein [Ignavibacteria bacterium]
MSLVHGVEVKDDCIHFRGDVPCKPHKMYGVHCKDCISYVERKGRLLIIKLGAVGDVIRTTVILEPLRKKFPGFEIWWVSESPEVVPSSVPKRLKFNSEAIISLEAIHFDVVFNLDKDLHACALAERLNAEALFGYRLKNGVPYPANELAEAKFLTGVFDDINLQSRSSYPQEIIELCGLEYEGQEYEIDEPQGSPITLGSNGKKVIGLNTGCGNRWISRDWPVDSWQILINKLHSANYTVLLLGGPAEHDRNTYLQSATGALYHGTFPLPTFISIVNQCDVVVTLVTMALHVSVALRKQVVLINNIFNKYEFELYGRGVIIEPPLECKCFFANTCINTEYRCMDHLTSDTIFEAVISRMNYL